MSRSIEEYTLHHHEERDTEASWAVSQTGDSDKIFFLPKSRVERTERASRANRNIWIFEIPQWLAEREGLE